MVKLIDSYVTKKAPREPVEARQEQVVQSPTLSQDAPVRPPVAPPEPIQAATLEERAKADFRVFLTIIWRHLLHVDPSPVQLNMAYWLQHGPDRSIIMAFRGFSKSWITGAYALWRLFNDSDEKILVVSGSLQRAAATTNWCLMLIMTMPLLEAMRPKSNYRQSSQMFDVGNCIPGQSASFMAAGIGGQLVGFRGTCIIPDDVETQTNSLTVVMREKVLDAVKEFESVLTPGGVIKYLGTPHDRDSLYLNLLRLKNSDGSPVYQARIWPCHFPNEAEVSNYGTWLAPYMLAQIRKHGPSIIGHSTMPNRFTDDDLDKRRAAMGNSEFRLQFLLDLKGAFKNSTPLKLKDLTVMDLDDKMGPDEVVWGTSNLLRDLPVQGTDGDFFHGPVEAERRQYVKWNSVVGFLDPSGRGKDESALVIGAELNAKLFALHCVASREGFTPETLLKFGRACVRFKVQVLKIEDNFGDGMFTALLRPVLTQCWAHYNAGKREEDKGGTSIVEVKSGKQGKEKRILSVMEPVTQQHRLVVSTRLVEDDWASIHGDQEDVGSDTAHRYSLFYQYTHLSAEPECLAHEDRLEALSGLVAHYAPVLGLDHMTAAEQSREDRYEAELEALLAEEEYAVGRSQRVREGSGRPLGTQPHKR